MCGAIVLLAVDAAVGQSALAVDGPSAEFFEYLGSLVEDGGEWIGPEEMAAAWLNDRSFDPNVPVTGRAEPSLPGASQAVLAAPGADATVEDEP